MRISDWSSDVCSSDLLPSMTSMTRTLDTDNERARSRDRLVICEPFTPGAGWISKRVMTGPGVAATTCALTPNARSEAHTSELQSLMRISYAVFCLKKNKHLIIIYFTTTTTQQNTKPL